MLGDLVVHLFFPLERLKILLLALGRVKVKLLLLVSKAVLLSFCGPGGCISLTPGLWDFHYGVFSIDSC